MKTSELIGAALDWAVAKCENVEVEVHSVQMIMKRWLRSLSSDEVATLPPPKPYLAIPGKGNAQYSTNWAQGGPIIEREKISLFRLEDTDRTDAKGFWIPGRDALYGAMSGDYFAEDQQRNGYGEDCGKIYYIGTDQVVTGPTTLIAAMRCYVASKLGNEVEIPDEMK
jgi:hypothetical protein